MTQPAQWYLMSKVFLANYRVFWTLEIIVSLRMNDLFLERY